MDIEDIQLLKWVIDYNQGSLDVKSQRALEAWLAQDDLNVKEFERIALLYKTSRARSFKSSIDKDEAWKRLQKSTIGSNKHRYMKWAYSVAAILVLAIVSNWMWFSHLDKDVDFDQLVNRTPSVPTLVLSDGTHKELSNYDDVLQESDIRVNIQKNRKLSYEVDTAKEVVVPDDQELIYNELIVPKTADYFVKLSDGTKVWLNSDSKMRYPVAFGTTHREVYLSGEAYFEVAHNDDAPFVVHTSTSDIKVLGTHFNVKCYNNKEYTTLCEGKVKVSTETDEIVLFPDFQSTVAPDQSIAVNKVNTSLITSWKTGVYEFEDESLQEICSLLERWYAIKINMNSVNKMHLSGAIKKNQSLNYTIELIETVAHVNFEIENNQITINQAL